MSTALGTGKSEAADSCGTLLEQVTQRGGSCPIPGNIQAQVERGSEQPKLVENVPACHRGGGLGDLQRSLPTQTIL